MTTPWTHPLPGQDGQPANVLQRWGEIVDHHLVSTRRARLYAAHHHGSVPSERVHGLRLVLQRHHHHHPQPAVEGAAHLRVFHVARVSYPCKHLQYEWLIRYTLELLNRFLFFFTFAPHRRPLSSLEMLCGGYFQEKEEGGVLGRTRYEE